MDYIINFTAFCLPLILFSYWGIIGYAMLTLLRTQRNTIQNLLLAPAIGFSLSLMLVFWLNRLGIPIIHFGLFLTMILLALSISILCWRKPIFPFKRYWPFAAIFLLALFVTGRPLLQFGFDWISFGNDDMANYCLGALRFLNHGYFEIPNLNDLVNGKDYSLYYWFFHISNMVRAGSELALAYLSSFLKLNPIQLFMPMILALHLTLISSTFALVYTRRSNFFIALASGIVLTFSALTSLGTLYQLVSQVAGLSLLVASTLLLFQPFTIHKKFYASSQALLIAITVSALSVIYPEVLPFLILSYIIYTLISLVKGWRINKSYCVVLSCAAILILVFLNLHLFSIYEFTLVQSTTSEAHTHVAVFPYYMIPSGLADVWGLQGIAQAFDEPWMSLTILLSAMLMIVSFVFILRLTIRKKPLPYAIVSLVMLIVGIILYKNNDGFGLFKLAMFIQPFIICVMVVSLFNVCKPTFLKTLIVLIFILFNLHSLNFYLARSKALTPGAFNEIAFGSTTKITKEFSSIIENLSSNVLLLSDDTNLTILKFQALLSRGKCFSPLLSTFIFDNFVHQYLAINSPFLNFYKKYLYFNKSKQLMTEFNKHNSAFSAPSQFNLHYAGQPAMTFFQTNVCFNSKICNEQGIIISDTSLRSVFNRRHFSSQNKHNFVVQKYNEIKNHLIFADSALGSLYNATQYSKHSNKILSIFNLEADPIIPNMTMQSIGHYALFRIINPTPKIRLELALTNTFEGNGINQLPSSFVVGQTRVKLSLLGRGSARVFSEPFSAQLINGIPYIALDMNSNGITPQARRLGLMNLYGKNISLETRKIVSFVRDISLISEEEYQQLNAPSEIKHFPNDLTNKDLSYSGIYEDGWSSENSYLYLKQPSLHNNLIINIKLAKLEQQFSGTMLTVLLDDKTILAKKLSPGDITLNIPVNSTKIARRKIELHFTNSQHLPKGDERIVGAQINMIGFIPS